MRWVGCVLLYRSPVEGGGRRDLKTVGVSAQADAAASGTARRPQTPATTARCGSARSSSRWAGHVLIYSTLGKVFWQSGVLDEATMKFTCEEDGAAGPRRVLCTQDAARCRGAEDSLGMDSGAALVRVAMKEAGWSGMMSLPRVMKLDADGTLRHEDLCRRQSALRAGKLPDQEIRAGVCKVLPKATGEVVCARGGGKGLLVHDEQWRSGDCCARETTRRQSHSFTASTAR